MYVQRNIVARSRDVCTSSATLTSWFHFSGRVRVNGRL